MKLTDNRWLTGWGFGVHSPWAYDLIENVINERLPYYAYEDLYYFWEKRPSICHSIRRAGTNCCSGW